MADATTKDAANRIAAMVARTLNEHIDGATVLGIDAVIAIRLDGKERAVRVTVGRDNAGRDLAREATNQIHAAAGPDGRTFLPLDPAGKH